MRQIDSQTHLFVLVVHLIAFDAWSIGIFSREFQELYNCGLQGRPANLPALRGQYASVAVREREISSDTLAAGHLEYWQSRLKDAPVLDLPTDRGPNS